MGWDASFASRADSGNLTVGIIGLGYVGLPTAIGFRDAGFDVWGVDVSERIVNSLHQGINPLGDPDLDDMIPAPGSERWTITTSTEQATKSCDVLIVTVPTPVSDDLKPDLSYVENAWGLGVSDKIINSQPTDGLWDDGRNDVQQLGMSYEDLERAMENKKDPNYQKYLKIREKNLHKMNPIPVCKFNE